MRLQDVEDLSTDARRAFWRQGAGILRADLWSANMPCAGVVCLHAERASASDLQRILRGLEEAEFRAIQSVRILRVLLLLPLFRGGARGLLAELVAPRQP